MELNNRGPVAFYLNFGERRSVPLTREAARQAADFVLEQARKREFAGKSVVQIDVTHDGQRCEWCGSVADARRLVKSIVAQLACGQQVGKIETITRDANGEISRVETLIHY